MTANEIRAALLREASSMDRVGHTNAARDLAAFAKSARSEELIRLREILISSDEPVNPAAWPRRPLSVSVRQVGEQI